MCFPSSISEIDFYDCQLSPDELEQAMDAYKNKWVDEVVSFQLMRDKQYGGAASKCSLVKCLPEELQGKFWDRYSKAPKPKLRMAFAGGMM